LVDSIVAEERNLSWAALEVLRRVLEMNSKIGSALVALAALLGVQSQASANDITPPPPVPIPALSGTNEQIACSTAALTSCVPGGTNIPPVGSATTVSGTTAFVTATVGLSPNPNISAILVGATGSLEDVFVSYGFEVVDPFAPVGFTAPVSITFSSNGDVVGTATDNDTATVGIFTVAAFAAFMAGADANPFFAAEAGTKGSGASATSFSVAQDLTGVNSLESNTAYVVAMEVFLTPTSSSDVVATGYVDPTITVDPGQLDSAGQPEFDVEFGPGVSDTPLPPTWIMMLSGLLGLGLFAHRHGKNGSSAVI
jgi:hypothetical protein